MAIMQATPKQLLSVWSFAKKFGSHNLSMPQWKAINNNGKITKAAVSRVIGAHKIWQDDQTQELDTVVYDFYQFHVDSSWALKEAGSETDEVEVNPDPDKADDSEDKPKKPRGDKSVVELLEELQEQIDEVEEQEPVPSEPNGLVEYEVSDGYVKPELFDKVANYLQRGKRNVLLNGPAGTGKSRMAEEIAKSFGIDFFTMSFSGGSKFSQVFGGKDIEIDPETKLQKTVWNPTHFLRNIQEPGLTLLDEIWSAEGDTLLGINSLLETNTRCYTAPTGERFEVHPDHYFVGAANTNGRSVSRQYVGANRADDSVLDRFVSLTMDYSERVEEYLMADLHHSTRTYFKQQLRDLRRGVRANNISFDPSTRRLLTAIVLVDIVPKEEAFNDAFLTGFSETELRKLGFA